jgi:hypothetical protein
MGLIALDSRLLPALLVTHTRSAAQVGAHRIRGTTSADFGHLAQLSQPEMASSAHQLAGAPETDIAAALATLRLSQQQQQAAVAAANGYGSG